MILETSIQPKEVDTVFSVAFLGMNPDERETWTDRLKWYESFRLNPSQPKTFMERVKSGKDVFDWIKRITAKALNESEAHPDKSSWKEELEQSIPALQKTLQQNEEHNKGKMRTKQETEALRDAKQALSDAQFLLAYTSGLVKQENNTPFVTSPETALWVQIATHLVDKHILKNKNGYGYSPNGQYFKKADDFNDAVYKYCKENNITLNLKDRKHTPLAKFIELGLLYPPIAKGRYTNIDDFCNRYLCNKTRKKKS